jgi:uncharacterized protein YydD (DUF2326 family)
MKLTKLYTNKPQQFDPVLFVDGLNVVIAEIRMPENKKKDTHNLGKTTLGRLIDFLLLPSRDGNFFLYKHSDRFADFVFFLEVELEKDAHVTIRRSVEEPTKISFKKHKRRAQDFTDLADREWDHRALPIERAKQLLDGILDLRALKPWEYRRQLGYLLRSQDDFRDVFQLNKFVGKHSNWKPFLAHMLGFNAGNVEDFYKKEEELSTTQAKAETIRTELGGSIEDASKIEGLLLLKASEAEKKQALLDAFDFRVPDKEKTVQVVDEIDTAIAALNSRRYSLNHNRKKIVSSLDEDQILFNPDDAEKLFNEAGVLFKGQVKKDFEQLIEFNKAITEERRTYLEEERVGIEAELQRVNAELEQIGLRRSDTLSFLSSTDVFAKYKQLTNELVTLRADIASLERQREFLRTLQELRTEIRRLTDEKEALQAKIETDVEEQNHEKTSLFSNIRLFFSEIIEEVIDRKALLSVTPNNNGHLEFKAEILDGGGNATSADMGFTYRKLLCIAFDMAILRAHLKMAFPRFVYHDGVFESLDDRKKEKLLGVIRDYTGFGLQHIITAIDSDLPSRENDNPIFDPNEIILVLHDEGTRGRIFKMPTW